MCRGRPCSSAVLLQQHKRKEKINVPTQRSGLNHKRGTPFYHPPHPISSKWVRICFVLLQRPKSTMTSNINGSVLNRASRTTWAQICATHQPREASRSSPWRLPPVHLERSAWSGWIATIGKSRGRTQGHGKGKNANKPRGWPKAHKPPSSNEPKRWASQKTSSILKLHTGERHEIKWCDQQ